MESAQPDPLIRPISSQFPPTPQTGSRSAHGEGGALDRPGFAWAVFEWARNPYYILIVIYVFAPYFARSYFALAH